MVGFFVEVDRAIRYRFEDDDDWSGISSGISLRVVFERADLP